MHMAPLTPNQGIGSPKGPETTTSVVSQPVKMDVINGPLNTLLAGISQISESTPTKPSEHWSGGSSSSAIATSGTGGSTGMSARDIAIAQIPTPVVMQKELEKHILTEVTKLRKQAKHIARIGKPGGAYHLNQLYTRIRHLNALLSDIFGASVEVLKRIFIRVFLDKQPIL